MAQGRLMISIDGIPDDIDDIPDDVVESPTIPLSDGVVECVFGGPCDGYGFLIYDTPNVFCPLRNDKYAHYYLIKNPLRYIYIATYKE
jgi:hypothetical protein